METTTEEITEEITLEYDVDASHVDMCHKPLAACPVCAESFGLRSNT